MVALEKHTITHTQYSSDFKRDLNLLESEEC